MDDSEQPVDTGVGDDVVTISAPARSLNWGVIGLIAVAVWWVYNNLDGAHED